MSLNQKYTWQDFLKEHPEHKEKKTKRTSDEGEKAFDSAYKDHIKKYLTSRDAMIGKAILRVTEKRDGYVIKLKEFNKAESASRSKAAQSVVSRADAYLARLKRLKEKNQQLQKNFK